MPELPEITVWARQMKTELVGKTFTHVEVLQPKCLNVSQEVFVEGLSGARLLDVTYRGKWILVETTQGWLLLNLGMGGEILLATHDTLPEKHRLIFDFDDGACLAVNFWWLCEQLTMLFPPLAMRIGHRRPFACPLPPTLHERPRPQ